MAEGTVKDLLVSGAAAGRRGDVWGVYALNLTGQDLATRAPRRDDGGRLRPDTEGAPSCAC